LVVEDNASACAGLATLLQEEGWTVLQAANGAEALETLRVVRPHLIFLAMLMPVMDGWQFLRELRRTMPDLAVPIIVTTTIGIACREWDQAHGCAGDVRKPIQVDELFAEVRRLAPKLRMAAPPRSATHGGWRPGALLFAGAARRLHSPKSMRLPNETRTHAARASFSPLTVSPQMAELMARWERARQDSLLLVKRIEQALEALQVNRSLSALIRGR
jgi:CheY-like chemotaxis protein